MSDTHEHHGHEEGQPHIHVMPMKVLATIFVLLLILTWVTYAASWAARNGVLDLGGGNVIVALIIALVKASLVALYFMHLKYDSLFNSIVLIGALLFVVLFIGISLLDTREYQPNRLEYKQANPPAAPTG